MIEETPEQIYERRGNDYLRDQLALLRKDPKLRQKLTLLRVECRRCSKTLVEAIATRPLWVVVSRKAESARATPDGLYDTPGVTGMERGRLIAQRRREAGQDNPIRRSDEPGFFPIPREPDDRAAITALVAVCECQQFERRMTWLYSELEQAPKDGQTRVVGVSPPDYDR